MFQTGGFLILSVLCTSFVGGCFSSGTSKKDEASKLIDKETEALALELNDNSILRSQPKADISTEEKLQKVWSYGDLP